ncbi:MAG: peptide-methionine (S)-S-oxide reductase MsrA [Candidatus Baltobacteraceae bacterium]
MKNFGIRLARAGATALLVFSLLSPVAASAAQEKAVLAGGCFWGMEGVFESLRGVSNVVSGFAGGNRETAQYETVSTGTTGHAESVEITFDPARISYAQLLKVYFFVAHDPTQLNRQGPDSGSQYRSAIFYENDAQKQAALASIRTLRAQKKFGAPIVTQVVPLRGFYAAEDYHQHYLKNHPYDPYIVYNDMPKLAALHEKFPQLLKGR